MNLESNLERASLLISQRRYKQAIELLHLILASSPNLGIAHSWLALCLTNNRDHLIEATREAEQAVHLAPDDAYSHYVLSVVWMIRNRWDSALEAIDNTIALSPGDGEYHGTRAEILANLERWAESLKAAETGLSFDPESDKCMAARVLALERLGRVSESLKESEAAIRNDPDSSHAHAMRGWALLQRGDYRGSQAAFREALRLEPSSEFARSGMIQALNSSNFFFRFFYRAMIALSRLDSRVRWGLIIGLWFGMQFLSGLAKTYPALAPWVTPLSIFYLLFVMMSWIMMPLFNTFLRFHPFGKHLLSKKEKWASNLIFGSLLYGLVSGGIALGVWGIPQLAVLPVLHGIYMTIPISVAFNTEVKWATIVAAVIASLFAVVFLVNTLSLMFGAIILPLMLGFTFGILIYCFLGQWLTRARRRI